MHRDHIIPPADGPPSCRRGLHYLVHAVAMTRVYAIVGDRDAALAQLDYLLSNPSWISVPWLEMHPCWSSLRGDPKFEQLLDRHRSPAGSVSS